jgi:hypothetical protein
VALLAFAASCEGPLPPPARVGSVRIVDPPAAIQVGETVRLGAVVLDPSDEPLTDVPVYWGAVDTMVLQVDSVTGIAHAHVPGTTRVSASSKDQKDRVNIMVPEGPRVAFNTVVPDQLGPADDADEFTFQGEQGQRVNVFLQGLSGMAAHRFRLRVLAPGGNVLDSVTSLGNDAALRPQAIQWLTLPQGGTYRVRVDATLSGGQGPYQLMVETVNPAPESAPAALVSGTPVKAEGLSPGDIDEFTFSGSEGEEISLVFDANSGSPADALRLRLLAPNGGEVVFVQSNGDYRDKQTSGRLRLPQGGAYTVRIQGVDTGDGGPYEVLFTRIDRRPEVAPAAVTADRVVGTDSISPPGDVDEFMFTVADSQEVNVYLQSLGAAGDSLVLRVLRPDNTTPDTLRSPGGDTTLAGHAISHLKLAPATYRIQVEGGRKTQTAYRFLVRAIDLRPEEVPAAYTLGTVVDKESISPVGDVDEFTFSGTMGDVVQIAFRATSGSENDVLRLRLLAPAVGELLYVETTGNQPEQVFPATLPRTGVYRIRVEGLNSCDDSGRYRFKIVKLN